MQHPKRHMKILSSRTVIHYPPKEPYFDTFDLNETIEMTENKIPLFITHTSLQLRLSDHQSSPVVAPKAHNDIKALNTIRQHHRQLRTQSTNIWHQERTYTLRQQIINQHIRLDDLIEEARGSGQIADLIRIRDYLQAFPQKVDKIVEQIRDNQGTSFSSGMIHTLELAGTAQAQKALLELARSSDIIQLDRLRALAAIGGVEHPSPETVEDVVHETEPPCSDTEATCYSATAIYALGAMYRHTHDASQALINDSLDTIMRETDDTDKINAAIVAAGESDPDAHLDILLDKLNDPRASVQAKAIRALGHSTSDQAADAISSLIMQKNLKHSILAIAINAQDPKLADEALNRRIVSLTQNQKYNRVYAAAVDWLCRGVQRFPDDKAILEHLLPKLTDPEMIRHVVRVVR